MEKFIIMKNSDKPSESISHQITLKYIIQLLYSSKSTRLTGYTLSGMDRDSMPDFFIQKRGHLLSPRYTINSPQKS